jgi:hypothetical protein
MITRLFHALFGLLWIGGFCLAGCQNPTGTVEPTVNINRLLTQAAETIQAGRQMTELAHPATSKPTVSAAAPGTPATSTPAASTQAATAAPVGVTATAVPLPGFTETQPPVQAFETLALAATISGAQGVDSAQFVSMAPGNGVQVKIGSVWEMQVKVINTGDKTWTIDYNLAYVRGDLMDGLDDLHLLHTVKPSETYTFVFTLQAPPSAGARQVTWALRDESGKDLLTIDFEVQVVA